MAKPIFAPMEAAFAKHIKTTFPQLLDRKSILAISGGLDSMVLAQLLLAAGVDFALAHCNFKLRGVESDGDAKFIGTFAKAQNLEFYVQSFDTIKYAEVNRVSTQMAARDLRYSWFSELLTETDCDFVLTAHHADDDLETFFINLSRGSGIDGLTGIPAQNDVVVRPLLPFSREQILAYAKKKQIVWREDSSNAKTDYLRNALRHKVVPKLKDWSPQFLSQWQTSQKHLQQASGLIGDYLAMIYPKLVTETFAGYQIHLNVLKELNHQEGVLYYLLKDFGFTAWPDIYELPNAETGKRIFSHSHQLLKNREVLLLNIREEQPTGEIEINEGSKSISFPGGSLQISSTAQFRESGKNTAYFDTAQLNFPLILRKWKDGDYFYPFGMHGRKKLSKYFKDQKLSLPEKDAVWLLCNATDIIWVAGHRTDERYRVFPKTTDLLKFEIFYEK
ncbi:MAG: tRNA lysidine(34) synthetase TilS [Leeuwenhoekiella sp.]